MLREKLARNRVGEEEGFTWRGEEVSRIEGLSDAVFAFAITLLVVSLEVPKTFDELLATMRGFFAFAICFALLFAVWNEHYKFSRRYGLWDASTVRLNAALLFIVLLYVYPLKFLFTILVDELLGFSTDVRLPTGDVVQAIEPGQIPLLMVIYGAGFVAIQVLFVLLYLRAYALRGTLELDANEVLITRQEIQGFLLMMAVVGSTGRCNTIDFWCCSDRRCASGETGASGRVVRGGQEGVVGEVEGRGVRQRHLQGSKEAPRLHPRDAQGHRRYSPARATQGVLGSHPGRAGGDLSGSRCRRFDARHRLTPGPDRLDRQPGGGPQRRARRIPGHESG